MIGRFFVRFTGRLLVAVALSQVLSASGQAQSVDWTGDGDGVSWSDPDNWFPASVPYGGNVYINDPDANVLIDASLADPVQLRVLDCRGSLIVSNWEFGLSEPSVIDKDFVIDRSTVTVVKDPWIGTGLTVNGQLQIGDSNLNGDGPITVWGDARLTGLCFLFDDGPLTFRGRLDSTGIIHIYERYIHTWGPTEIRNTFHSSAEIPVWHIHDTCDVTLINAFTQFLTIENEGHMLFGQGEFDVSTIRGPFTSYQGSSVHVVAGEVNIDSQAGSARADFHGDIIVDHSGDLWVQTETTIWPTSTIAGEGVLHLKTLNTSQVLTSQIGIRRLHVNPGLLQYTIEFTGSFNIRELWMDTNGKLVGPASITVENLFTFERGSISGSGTVHNLGSLEILGTGATNMGQSRILRNSGVAVLRDGGRLMPDADFNGVFHNDPSGSFTVASQGEIGVTFFNEGQFTKNSPDPLTITGWMDQRGNFVLNSGVTNSVGGGSWRGDIEVTNGATLHAEGAARTFEADGNLFGEGTLEFDFGTTHVFCDINVAQTEIQAGDHYFYNDIHARSVKQTNGTIHGPGTLNVNSIFTCEGGNMYSGVVNTNSTAILQGPGFMLGDHNLNLNGTTVWVDDGIIGWNGDAQVTNNGTFDIQNTGECRQPFSNYGSLIKSQGNDSYFGRGIYNEGHVTVQTGSLRMEAGQQYFQDRGSTTLAGGAIDPYPGSPARIEGGDLKGFGSIDGDLVIGPAGSISPGELGTDIISVTGDYTQLPLGTYVCELAGTAPGTQHDQVVVSGQANLSGIMRVHLTDGYIPTAGTSLRVLTASSITGRFDEVSPPANLPSALLMRVTYDQSSVRLTFVNRFHSENTAIRR